MSVLSIMDRTFNLSVRWGDTVFKEVLHLDLDPWGVVEIILSLYW